MRVKLGVRGFGKIKEALICVSDYVVFVGDNNSGKTYLMQLVYAVRKYLSIKTNNSQLVSIIQEKVINKDEVLQIDGSNTQLIVDAVNDFLDKEKEIIVLNTFKKEVPIDKLWIEIEGDESDDYRIVIGRSSNTLEMLDEISAKNPERFYLTIFNGKINGIANSYVIEGTIDPVILARYVCKAIFGFRGQRYLPASRAGIQLLYRDFFAAKADDVFYSETDKKSTNDIRLSEPIYDYLKFLQTFNKRKMPADDKGDLIAFIEGQLIDGHVDIDDRNEISYSQKNTGGKVQLHLASSMVSEIIPIMECIMSDKREYYLIIDEVETSLHPKKQREMARLLNRMRNKGWELLVSTHSDSMAAYINNLMIASQKNMNEEELRKMGLEKKDLLEKSKVFFYEFINQMDGSSIVKELRQKTYPSRGVDFTLFNDNLDNLYRESMEILGVTEA